MLQASQYEPAILHAVVTLGSVHERLETGASAVFPGSQFVLEQYGKSIRTISSLGRSKSKLEVNVTLMTCILFICIEVRTPALSIIGQSELRTFKTHQLQILLGHHGTAIAHIESGAKILLEEEEKHANSSMTDSSLRYVPLSTLSLVFVRLDLQASQILSHRPLYLRRESADKDSGFHSDIPTSFSTLDQARNAMDYLRNCVMRSLERITQAEEIFKPSREELDTDRKTCAIRLQQWSSAFELFLREHGHELNSIHQQGVSLLKIHMIMTAMNLDLQDLDVKWTETAYDWYMLEFEAIISHASSIIRAPKQAFRFSLDPGLVPALYFVTSKCRHAVIRRKAISLLSMAPRQEGVWDSAPVVRVLQRYVEIEEEGLGELTDAFDVPDCNRLSGIDAKFDLEGRRALVQYQRIWGPGAITKRQLQECIEW